MHKEEKRIQKMMRYRGLRTKMLSFENRYFSDMRFQEKNLLNNLAKTTYLLDDSSEETVTEDEWTLELNLRRWIIAYAGKEYKLQRDVGGICKSKSRLLVIRRYKDRREENNTILHEMTHAYESILKEDSRQFLVLYLYERLLKRLGRKRLWKYIYFDNHDAFKVHTPLFLLKSLDLDLRTKQALGTIYAYARAEYFSK